MIPRKRFGQHFLSDQKVIQRIVSSINPKPNELLIEIGPGQGALTLPVLKQAKVLTAIELDRDLITPLKKRCQDAGELDVIVGDVLKFDFNRWQNSNSRLRLFGNLPYNIATQIIFNLIEYLDLIADMTFMVQKEVAERLVAAVNTEHYSRLSVMVQYHCEVELLFDISPGAFYPPPQVRSTLIKLIPHRELPYVAKNYPLFEEIVRRAFGQRRKTVRNSLKAIVEDTDWTHLAVRSDARAENLSIKDFVEISNTMTVQKSGNNQTS